MVWSVTEAEDIKRWQEYTEEIYKKAKCKGAKERSASECTQFQKIARRDKQVFVSEQCKEIEENNSMKDQRSLQENQRYKEIFHTKKGTIKNNKVSNKCMDLTEAEDIKKRWQEYTELYKKRSS